MALKSLWSAGASIPLRQWCIFLCFRFPHYFWKKFGTPWKLCPIWSFPPKFPRFPSAKISDDLLLVIDLKFWISSYFRCFTTLPHILQKCYFSKWMLFSPLLLQISPWFCKIYVFYILYLFFVSPYFHHDAFMHHTMYVLDAPADQPYWLIPQDRSDPLRDSLPSEVCW